MPLFSLLKAISTVRARLLSTLTALAAIALFAAPASAQQVLNNAIGWGTGTSSTSTYNSGSYNFTGLGNGLQGTADSGYFQYAAVSGNVTITARIAAGNVSKDGFTGVMLRNDLTAGSPSMVSGWDNSFFRQQVQYDYRLTSNANIGTPTYTGAAPTNPVWLQMTRSGNTFTASYSTDGTTFHAYQTQTIVMGTSFYAGIWIDNWDIPSTGNAVIWDTVTVSGLLPVLSAGTASIPCSLTANGATTTCATQTLTALNGPITLGTAPFSSSDAQFSISPGTCTANLLLAQNASCTTGAVTFNPTSLGVKSTTITVSSSAPAATFAATGTVAGTAVAVPSITTCPALIFGANENCGFTTVTATGGPITFAATPFTSSDTTNFFPRTASTCTANLALLINGTCTIASNATPYLFAPASIGSFSDTVTINLVAGTGTSYTLTGIGTVGTLVPTPSSVSCGNATTVNSVTCPTPSVIRSTRWPRAAPVPVSPW
jgi:hypothetical protein